MRIEDKKKNEICTMQDWASLYACTELSRQWKEHRSAYSAAEFILNRNGADHLQSRLSAALEG